MTLRALINSSEPGRICDIRPVGEEFEVHSAFQWVDVPDGTTTHDTYNQDSTVTKFDILQVPGFAEHGYKVARTIAYSGIGEQLDMLYKELQNTGTISNAGPWATHVAGVKSAIPKDNPQAVYEWNMQYLASTSGNV